jgi:hypothetical protein
VANTKNFIVKNGVTTGNIVLSALDGSITASSANLSGDIVNVGNITSHGNASIAGDISNVGNISANGNLSINSITASGITNVGSIGNLKVTGGNAGDAIVTDGAGNLSFTVVGGIAPMPYYIFSGNTTIVPNLYQALSGMAYITVDGNLDIEGYYIEV